MEQASPHAGGRLRIAHRGAPRASRSRENTRLAFERARAAGYTHVETDLRLDRNRCLRLAHYARQLPRAASLEDCWPVLREFAWINLELKEPDVAEALARWLEREAPSDDLRQRIVISAFDFGTLALARELLPWARLAVLFPWDATELSWPEGLRPESIHLAKELAANLEGKPARFGQRPVYAFTVNDERWWHRMPNWVEGVFTDSLPPLSRH
ncbi:MAG: glycerophosphodiester phosphodiesterase [Verrucomicrobiota bacterium]